MDVYVFCKCCLRARGSCGLFSFRCQCHAMYIICHQVFKRGCKLECVDIVHLYPVVRPANFSKLSPGSSELCTCLNRKASISTVYTPVNVRIVKYTAPAFPSSFFPLFQSRVQTCCAAFRDRRVDVGVCNLHASWQVLSMKFF